MIAPPSFFRPTPTPRQILTADGGERRGGRAYKRVREESLQENAREREGARREGTRRTNDLLQNSQKKNFKR